MKSDLSIAALVKSGLFVLVLAPLMVAVPWSVGGTACPMTKSLYDVTGHVTVFQPDLIEGLKDRSGVVVWLASTQSAQRMRLGIDPPHYRMIQIHKAFEPHLLVVPAGSIVEFPNYDPWFHNVFSISAGQRFDLGFYGSGVLKAVKFDRPGISYLFCSIHPETMGIILTVNSSYFGISDTTGRIFIGGVPPGRYFRNVWYQNAAPELLQALRRAVFVGADNRRLPPISIALSNRILATHPNKNHTVEPYSQSRTGDDDD